MADISEDLSRSFAAHAATPEHREMVIVTLADGADGSELSRLGMDVTVQMRNRPIAMGSITAAALQALSNWEGVVRIEPDKPDMQALDD